MNMKDGLIKGNEELNEHLLEREKCLLEERESLELLFEETKEEDIEVFYELTQLHKKNQNYKSYKKRLILRFIVNFFEILLTMILFAVVPNAIFNFSVKTLKILYSVLGISFVSINSILFGIMKSEIKDYIKNEDENDYNGKNITYLEERKESIEEHIEELKQQLRINESKINKLYNSFRKRGIVSPRNNEYVKEDNSVKSKQKMIEKK